MAWESERVWIPDGAEVVCWDLDSTIRSTMHRRHLIPEIRAGRATWDHYSLLCGDDAPIEGAVELMRMLGQHGHIAVSGCADSALDITRDWCRKHDVPLDDFIMRPAGDQTPNGEWKVSAVRKLRAAGLIVRLFVEDWAPAARYIRAQAGVPVLGVNPFDPETCLVGRAQLAMEIDQEMELANRGNPDMADRIFARIAGEHA